MSLFKKNKLSQMDTILYAMLENKKRIWWSAKDFQNGKYFVGYEATARISELVQKYDDLIKVGKDGRFRIISINWDSEKLKEQQKRFELI